MSDVIDFLEKLGQDSTLRHATGAQLQSELSDVDPLLRAALIAGDRNAIEALLGADNNVCCMINVPQEEEASLVTRDNVCCMIYAPMQEEEASPSTRDDDVARQAADNVCCLVFAPLQEEEEPAPLQRSA